MLLDCDGVVSTALEREVIGDDHALSAVDVADTCDDIARWDTLVESS